MVNYLLLCVNLKCVPYEIICKSKQKFKQMTFKYNVNRYAGQ